MHELRIGRRGRAEEQRDEHAAGGRQRRNGYENQSENTLHDRLYR